MLVQPFRIFELVLGLIILLLHGFSFAYDGMLIGDSDGCALYVTVAFSTTILASLCLSMSVFSADDERDVAEYFMSMVYCVVGAVLYLVASSIVLKDFVHYQDDNPQNLTQSTIGVGIAKGSLGVVQCVLFIVDALYTTYTYYFE